MKELFSTIVTDCELTDFEPLADSKDFDGMFDLDFTLDKVRINWEFAPDFKNWGINSFGLKLLPLQSIEITYRGQQNTHLVGIEDGEPDYDTDDCEGTYLINTKDWSSDCQVDLYQTPMEFKPTEVKFNFKNKHILIIF